MPSITYAIPNTKRERYRQESLVHIGIAHLFDVSAQASQTSLHVCQCFQMELIMIHLLD